MRSPIGAASLLDRKIVLSAPCFAVNNKQWIENVILHEITHILVWGKEKNSHGDLWKAKAIEIGCNGEIYGDDRGNMPKGRYEAICPVCGKKHYRYEFTLSSHGKVVRNTDEYLKNILSKTFKCRLRCGGYFKYVDLKRKLNWLTNAWNRKNLLRTKDESFI